MMHLLVWTVISKSIFFPQNINNKSSFKLNHSCALVIFIEPKFKEKLFLVQPFEVGSKPFNTLKNCYF